MKLKLKFFSIIISSLYVCGIINSSWGFNPNDGMFESFGGGRGAGGPRAASNRFGRGSVAGGPMGNQMGGPVGGRVGATGSGRVGRAGATGGPMGNQMGGPVGGRVGATGSGRVGRAGATGGSMGNQMGGPMGNPMNPLMGGRAGAMGGPMGNLMGGPMGNPMNPLMGGRAGATGGPIGNLMGGPMGLGAPVMGGGAICDTGLNTVGNFVNAGLALNSGMPGLGALNLGQCTEQELADIRDRSMIIQGTINQIQQGNQNLSNLVAQNAAADAARNLLSTQQTGERILDNQRATNKFTQNLTNSSREQNSTFQANQNQMQQQLEQEHNRRMGQQFQAGQESLQDMRRRHNIRHQVDMHSLVQINNQIDNTITQTQLGAQQAHQQYMANLERIRLEGQLQDQKNRATENLLRDRLFEMRLNSNNPSQRANSVPAVNRNISGANTANQRPQNETWSVNQPNIQTNFSGARQTGSQVPVGNNARTVGLPAQAQINQPNTQQRLLGPNDMRNSQMNINFEPASGFENQFDGRSSAVNRNPSVANRPNLSPANRDTSVTQAPGLANLAQQTIGSQPSSSRLPSRLSSRNSGNTGSAPQPTTTARPIATSRLGNRG